MLDSLAEDFGVRYNQMIHCLQENQVYFPLQENSTATCHHYQKVYQNSSVKMNPSEILRASFYIYYKSKIGPYSKITAQ